MIGICEVIAIKEHPKYLEIVFEMIFFGLFEWFGKRLDRLINQGNILLNSVIQHELILWL